MPDHALVLERLKAELFQNFVGGTRVINCVVHAEKEWDQRPAECLHCLTDLRNQLVFTYRVNEWVNARLDAAREILAVVEQAAPERQPEIEYGQEHPWKRFDDWHAVDHQLVGYSWPCTRPLRCLWRYTRKTDAVLDQRGFRERP